MGPSYWSLGGTLEYVSQLSSLVQIGKTGRPFLRFPLTFPLRPPRSLACGEGAPPLPDSAKEVAWVAINIPC